MHGFVKGHYATSVLFTKGPSDLQASAMFGFTHHAAYGELNHGGKHDVHNAEAKK